MHPNNLPHDKALPFIMGGNALFTILSLKTDTRFTYKVLVSSKDNSVLRVSLLYGKDNTADYKMIGQIVIDENGQPMFHPISIHTKDTPAVKAFEYMFMNLCIGYSMPSLEIWHEGRCGRCGRVLTVPDSIMNGIGPECAFKESRVNYR